MALVMGVDSSTQSTKVEVRDLDTGAVVAVGAAPHPATGSPRSEQDPQAWWQALVAAVTATGVRKVDAISISGQQHGLVVLGADGQVLRPAKLWNDTEAAPDAAALVARLGADELAQATGSVPVAAFTIAKVAWLARVEPATCAAVRTVLLPHDWLTSRLTGVFTTDRGDASGTGYWSPAQNRWRPELLHHAATRSDPGGEVLRRERRRAAHPDSGLDPDAAAWAERLPRVLAPTEVAGTLGASAAAALGLEPGCVVAPGTGDNMAAALGVALRPGELAISLGTSGTVYAVSEVPTADATGAVAGFADATGRFLPLVCTLNATQVTDTVARLLGVDLAQLDALAGAAPAGAAGLVLVPYLNGERTPNRPEAAGALHGLRTDATREQLARAAFEGVVCGLLEGADALTRAGVPSGDGRVVLVGGGARSPRYRQVVADLSGRPVTVPTTTEQAAAGSCVQAAATVLGCAPDEVARGWGLDAGTVVEPDATVSRDRAAAVRAAYAAARG